MRDTQNNDSISLEQHQKAMNALEKRLTEQHQKDMSILEKKLTEANAKFAKAEARAEKTKAKANAEIGDIQRWKGTENFGKIRGKIKTQLTKIFKRQESEIKSLKKAYKKFQSREGKIYNPFTKRWIKKDGKIGRSLPDTVKESWDAEILAEEEMEWWEKEILEEEERRASEPRLEDSAIEDTVQKWVIDGNEYRDPRVFLDSTTAGVERVINETDSTGKKVYFKASLG